MAASAALDRVRTFAASFRQGTAPVAPFEWILAGRYLRARRRGGGVSVVAFFSVLG
ncbi:lipoprotein-releasing system transmembrane subunit LolC, partial [Escherichia coli]|nr:lipoprotein-releasing system transmembrane subunit LolC [Escherichia coli]